MDKPEITHMKVFSAQVCVPKNYSDKKTIEFLEQEYPCGTTGGWTIQTDDPVRILCREKSEYVHIVLVA